MRERAVAVATVKPLATRRSGNGASEAAKRKPDAIETRRAGT